MKEEKVTRIKTELDLDSYEFDLFTDFLAILKKRKEAREAGKTPNKFDDFLPREITAKGVEEGYNYFMTVGKLKKNLEDYNLPDDGKVLVQRIEDFYYKKNGWGVVYKEGFHTCGAKETNKKVEAGEYHDKEEYPDMTEEMIEAMKTSEEEMKYTMEQYHPAFCSVKFKDDDKNLYIDLHY